MTNALIAEVRDLEERRRVDEMQSSVQESVGQQDVLVVRVGHAGGCIAYTAKTTALTTAA